MTDQPYDWGLRPTDHDNYDHGFMAALNNLSMGPYHPVPHVCRGGTTTTTDRIERLGLTTHQLGLRNTAVSRVDGRGLLRCGTTNAEADSPQDRTVRRQVQPMTDSEPQQQATVRPKHWSGK